MANVIEALYGDEVSVETTVPLRRNSTLLTEPSGSLAVAVKATDPPRGMLMPLNGAVRATTGGRFVAERLMVTESNRNQVVLSASRVLVPAANTRYR